jgi:hypothetical protein
MRLTILNEEEINRLYGIPRFTQLPAIFIAPVPAVASVRHDQLDAAFLQPLARGSES